MQYSIGVATEQSFKYIKLTDAKIWISKMRHYVGFWQFGSHIRNMLYSYAMRFTARFILYYTNIIWWQRSTAIDTDMGYVIIDDIVRCILGARNTYEYMPLFFKSKYYYPNSINWYTLIGFLEVHTRVDIDMSVLHYWGCLDHRFPESHADRQLFCVI